MLKRDPQDIAPVRTKPLPREPIFKLTPRDGGDITSPRWTRDGKSILYTHKQPDREGFLHHDLFLWTPESHDNRRLTHAAGVEDADPLPDGKRAIAVRNQNGFSQLVTVDLTSGEVAPYNEPSLERIYSHPRASRQIVWAEHDSNGWSVRGVRGAFSPEWNGDKLYAAVASSGFIEIARIDNGVEPVTRSPGAAMDPAPAPDGSLYFMSLEPDGFVVRHLKPGDITLPPLSLETRFAPAIPPVLATAAAFRPELIASPRPYRFGRQEFGTAFGGSWTAYGESKEIGVRVGDVVGLLDALAIASSGSDSADRGAALIATWRGWPVAVTSHLFRSGIELRGNYEIHGAMTLLSIEAGGVDGKSSRFFAQSSFTARQKIASATLHAGIDSRQHVRASVRAAARFGAIRLAAAAEAANRMSLGGVASSITAESILLERVLEPALPLKFADVRHYRGARGEFTLSSLTAFWQRHSSNLTVRGIEWTSHTPPIPLLGLPALDMTAGAARVSGIRGTKGWLALRWRP